MNVIKTILVPTDFSVPADYAVHYAFKLAGEFDASMILYHSFIPFESGFYPLSQSKKENLETENNFIKLLNVIKESLLKSNKKISISIHVDRGPENKRIIEFCKKKHIDLIVMGTKGASGLKEVVIGSFTADVMTKAPCPVLAIPQNATLGTLKKITYISDYHKNDIPAINFLSELSKPFNAKINILHIDGEHASGREEKAFTQHKQEIKRQCKNVHLSFQHVAGQDISKAILQITSKNKTEILAMPLIRREGMWNRMFHKSIRKTMACHTHIPLLTIPIK